MIFIVAAQLPPALVDWLRAQGHDADHVSTLLRVDAPDDTIWRLARGNATRRALLDWLQPKWPQVEQHLSEGVHLIEVRA